MVLNPIREGRDSIKDRKKNIAYLIICFLYGAIALSAWSYYLLVDYIGLAFYAYEIFFIPLIFICRNKIIACIKTINSKYLFAFFVLVCFLLFGLIRYPEYLSSQITTYRTIFYIFFFMYFFSCTDTFHAAKLQFLCFGANVGQFLYILFVNSEADQTAINIMALAIMVILPIVKKKPKLLEILFFVALALLVAFRSSFRINIVVVLIAFVCAIFYSIFVQKKKKALFILAVIFVAGVILFLNLDRVISFLTESLQMNLMAIYRITDRLEAFFKLDFNASHDDLRFELFQQIVDQFEPCILPKGLIGKSTEEYGLYRDVPLIFLYHAFGSLVALGVIGFFSFKGAKYVIKSIRLRQDEMSLFGIMFPICIVLLLLNGTFMIATYEACLTGMVFGYWFNRKKIEVV